MKIIVYFLLLGAMATLYAATGEMEENQTKPGIPRSFHWLLRQSEREGHPRPELEVLFILKKMNVKSAQKNYLEIYRLFTSLDLRKASIHIKSAFSEKCDSSVRTWLEKHVINPYNDVWLTGNKVAFGDIALWESQKLQRALRGVVKNLENIINESCSEKVKQEEGHAFLKLRAALSHHEDLERPSFPVSRWEVDADGGAYPVYWPL